MCLYIAELTHSRFTAKNIFNTVTFGGDPYVRKKERERERDTKRAWFLVSGFT